MILVGLTSQPHRTRSRTQWVQKWSKLSCQHLKPIQECRTQFSFSRISILDVFLSKACLSRSFLTGKLKTLVLLGFIFTIFLVNALCFLHGWILIFLVNVFCFLNEWILLEKIDYEFLKTFLYWFFFLNKRFSRFFSIFSLLGCFIPHIRCITLRAFLLCPCFCPIWPHGQDPNGIAGLVPGRFLLLLMGFLNNQITAAVCFFAISPSWLDLIGFSYTFFFFFLFFFKNFVFFSWVFLVANNCCCMFCPWYLYFL